MADAYGVGREVAENRHFLQRKQFVEIGIRRFVC
jgi:hypothetical protein